MSDGGFCYCRKSLSECNCGPKPRTTDCGHVTPMMYRMKGKLLCKECMLREMNWDGPEDYCGDS